MALKKMLHPIPLLDPRLRWVGFLRELTHPIKVLPGMVLQLQDSFLAMLQATEEGRAAVLDLTPTPLAYHFAYLFQSPMTIPKAESNIVIMLCPSCARERGISACQHCEGTKRLIKVPDLEPISFMKAREENIAFIRKMATF